jgi:mRNA interferase HigB
VKVVNVSRLVDFWSAHAASQGALTAWLRTVEAARWRNLMDVRKTYPHADAVTVASGRTVTVFNIRGNNYRLLAGIDYRSSIVNVLQCLTHAEYNKEKWKGAL